MGPGRPDLARTPPHCDTHRAVPRPPTARRPRRALPGCLPCPGWACCGAGVACELPVRVGPGPLRPGAPSPPGGLPSFPARPPPKSTHSLGVTPRRRRRRRRPGHGFAGRPDSEPGNPAMVTNGDRRRRRRAGQHRRLRTGAGLWWANLWVGGCGGEGSASHTAATVQGALTSLASLTSLTSLGSLSGLSSLSLLQLCRSAGVEGCWCCASRSAAGHAA